MFNSFPNSVSSMVELVANSASLIVIFSEKGMSDDRKILLLVLLGIVVLCSLAKFSAYLKHSKSVHTAQSYDDLAFNKPFVIHGATLIKASGGNVFLHSTPNHNGNRLDILQEGAMAKYELSVLDEDGRTWHRGSCNGNTGWMCSTCTVLQ